MRAAWLAYYKALWCFRCYAWNPLGCRWAWASRVLDAMDEIPRGWVGKWVAR